MLQSHASCHYPPKVSSLFFVLVGILDFKTTNVVEASLLRWENGHPLICSWDIHTRHDKSLSGMRKAQKHRQTKTPATKHLDNILL